MEIDLNKLRDRAYKTACEHGFHDKEYSDEHWLMLVISEIGEAVNADRKGSIPNNDKFNEWMLSDNTHEHIFKNAFEKWIKDSVADELSDIVIRLLDLAGLRNIDLSGLNSNLTESNFNEYLGTIDETFTEMAYSLVQWLCEEDLSKQNIYTVIGGTFSVSYKYKIDLFQHIEWKMRYNELRPRLNGKEY